MEAAALYAFSRARACPVACFAHVISTMAQIEGDFEKGEAGSALDAINLISAAAGAWIQSGQSLHRKLRPALTRLRRFDRL